MLSRILRLLSLRRGENPGRALREIGVKREKARKRAVVDQMRRDMGLPPVKWPAL